MASKVYSFRLNPAHPQQQEAREYYDSRLAAGERAADVISLALLALKHQDDQQPDASQLARLIDVTERTMNMVQQLRTGGAVLSAEDEAALDLDSNFLAAMSKHAAPSIKLEDLE